ncbi:hypothetical protein AVEN_23215-1 [Araneus ventricosus]|uniref:Uncharacterized protein n=1 Tax=Araneus ventricosus TaxID=182803 RepID=A0A4Y2ME66_ARAVE|nr:hypothetical protein AVEN_23215-1 [Araneus ventricosus]
MNLTSYVCLNIPLQGSDLIDVNSHANSKETPNLRNSSAIVCAIFVEATVLFPAISIDSGFIIQISAYAGKGDPIHYATSIHMALSYHFTKPSAENTQHLWKSVLSNTLSSIKISKLISFLTENENLIKQPPDATSSSDSDPDFSPSPRPQTYRLRPSRGSIPRTEISPPTSI